MFNPKEFLQRLANNCKAKTQEEKDFLEKLAIKFNQRMPKYACPICWLKRLIKEIK